MLESTQNSNHYKGNKGWYSLEESSSGHCKMTEWKGIRRIAYRLYRSDQDVPAVGERMEL